MLVAERSGPNPINEFLDYVRVYERALEPPSDGNDSYWDAVRRSSKDHRLQLPEEPPMHIDKLTVLLEHLERELPEGFPILASNGAFVALIRRVEEADASDAFRAQLIRRPLATASNNNLIRLGSAGMLAQLTGWRIVCVDDNPDSLVELVKILEGLGASVKIYSSPVAADQEIKRWQPHAVISDITRGDDPSAGFKHVSRLRESGYDGPVVFFTARVTPERRRQAEELGALDIVTTEWGIIDTLAPQAIPTWFSQLNPRYSCPYGDFAWYRPSINTPIPSCPTHGGTLEPSLGSLLSSWRINAAPRYWSS